MSLSETSHYKYQHKTEMVSNMLSQSLIFKEETKTSAFKAHNLLESHLATSKYMGSLLNSGLICKSTISKLIPVQTGWTWNHLVHIFNLAEELKHNSQKWDDDVDRSLQFCNKIDEVMNQCQLLCNEKEIHRRQLCITALFSHL